MKRILFVCMGNICRSPAAEGVMQHLVNKSGLNDLIYIDSAGTIGYHTGEPADRRMRQHAKKRGIDLLSRSRKFDDASDFDDFDYILLMDDNNLQDISSRAQYARYKEKVFMMIDFCKARNDKDVPDPYYGGDAGFELVLDIIQDASVGLLERVKADLEKDG